MTFFHQIATILMLILSVVCVAIPVVHFFNNRKRPLEERTRNKNFIKFIYFLLFFASVWAVRFAVGCYTIAISADTAKSLGIETNDLNVVEEIFNSAAHALQTFSMDEDYTFYILVGKSMVNELTIFGGLAGVLAFLYGLYLSLLNIAAPIAGGAILLDILVGIFPQLKLWWNVKFSSRREKFYFSELNDRSFELAKSIYNRETEKIKPIIVFTDAYMDEENETHSELLTDAKNIGAICIREDIKHVKKPKGSSKCNYFLIDENEASNLYALVDLATEKNVKSIKNANIYLFSQNDIYTQVERRFNRRLREEYKFTDEMMPAVIPIKSFRNLAINLFDKLPLYEPIVGKAPNADGKRELTVTIVGIGGIGTEMFLTAYWMGQILDCNLKINVVSRENESAFVEKINYINPEILQTADAGNPILNYNNKGEKNAPYCKVSYIQADVDSGLFSGTAGEHACLSDTDYFVVSLGCDTANLAIAEKLRRYVGECHINEANNRKTVIAYAIYDSNMCETLNTRKKFYAHDPENPDIYMHAFGCLSEEYGYDNVFMPMFARFAADVGENYANVRYREELAKENKERVSEVDSDCKNISDSKNVDVAKDLKYEENEYNYWANVARVAHMKYKVFSLGWINSSVFDTASDGEKTHTKDVLDACVLYKGIALGKITDGNKVKEFDEKCNDLAWLEHRRWSAFSRVMGFRRTENHGVYMPLTASHKHMSLRLHPCLVESDRYGEDDFLDELGNKLCKQFKFYDSPRREFKAYEDKKASFD